MSLTLFQMAALIIMILNLLGVGAIVARVFNLGSWKGGVDSALKYGGEERDRMQNDHSILEGRFNKHVSPNGGH